VSQIRFKMEAESWLAEKLREEGPDLWKDRQREEHARKLAQDYRSGGPKWRVEEPDALVGLPQATLDQRAHIEPPGDLFGFEHRRAERVP
jgi:hypothetical protein